VLAGREVLVDRQLDGRTLYLSSGFSNENGGLVTGRLRGDCQPLSACAVELPSSQLDGGNRLTDVLWIFSVLTAAVWRVGRKTGMASMGGQPGRRRHKSERPGSSASAKIAIGVGCYLSTAVSERRAVAASSNFSAVVVVHCTVKVTPERIPVTTSSR